MSEQHQTSWSARDDAVWWPGSVAADQQSLQHHQHLLHQQQLAAAAHQQSMQHDARSTSTAASTHQLFTYKMASSFENPPTSVSNASSAGIRGFDYGSSTMSAPVTASQWWYPSQMESNMQNSIACSMQNNMQSIQSNTSAQLVQQEVQRQQQEAEAHRQHQEVQRQHQEAHRQQEVHRQHQEAQRQAEAIQQHNQAIAEAQARQQQQNNHLQHQHNIQAQQQSVLQQHISAQSPILAKGRMPRGKADARPKGRMTAYAFFVQTCREEHKKKHPDENVVFTEFTKKCAERWKTMLDKEKKRFHEMAEKDKKRYDAEMQNYTPPKGEKTRGKKRKQIKDPNAPKRSLSAFFWFCNDERSKVKSLNPEYGVGDIAKELGRRWSDADPETKAKYEAMAEKDKARYEKEMTAYKKKNNPALQAAVPEPEDDDEGEDEVEDDDDE